MKRKKKPVEVQPTEVNETDVKRKSKKTWIISIIACFLGLCVIALGIILPFALSDEYTDKEGVNPYAVMKLSNGMTINYEIWENECPIAATNFIYLAEIGYFDGTIIFDSQNGWVRLGGWQADSLHRGDDNKEFLSKITDRKYGKSDYSNNKFGYRLKNDTARSSYYDTVGVLSFCYERSATEFQVAASSDLSLTIPNDNNQDWKVAPFGMAADSESISNIVAIAALSRDETGEKFRHDYYRAPLDEDGLIKIESVKITKKNKDKWKNFDFMEYVKGENSSNVLYSWYSTKRVTGTKR